MILAGVKSVTLHDATPTTWWTSAQFYLSEPDLERPRGLLRAPRGAEPLVPWPARPTPWTRLSWRNSSAWSWSTRPWNAARCERLLPAAGKQFISTEVAGVFGYTFCDFGKAFVVADTGKNPSAASWRR